MVTITSSPRRWWALGAVFLCVLLIGLDATVLNVALPTLAHDLGASTGDLQWIIDAYLLPFAVLMLPMGALGDRFGRKRMLLGGVAAFGVASVVATFAHGIGTLIAARAIMGVGASGIVPLSMALLPAIFPKQERARAIAIWTAAMALGLPLGPIVGGYLLDHYWWGSIFLINIPLVVLALVAATVLLPESRDPGASRIDVPGGVLSVAGLTAFVYGIIEAPTSGWGDPVVLATIAAGIVLLAVFVRVESRTATPTIDLALFKDRVFMWGAIGVTTAGLSMTAVLFVTPLYLQAVVGHDAFGTGLRVIPLVGGLMVGGLSGDRLLKLLGLRVTMFAGFTVLAAGLAVAAFTSATSTYGFIATWLVIMGAGLGLAMVPAMDGVLATLPENRTGSGSATLSTLRQVGSTLGVAALGSLLSFVYASGLPEGTPEAAKDSVTAGVALGVPGAGQAYTSGMDVVLATCGGATLLAAALMLIFLPRRSQERAQSEHELVSGIA
ncbi:MFS transporter [Streptosporangiaceae bacterium NEAU-GS5]|nr:MFS transporter [Streptosporangiaceae bacterium NEAU-GS5]